MSWSIIRDLRFSLLSIGKGSGDANSETVEAAVASDSSAVTLANEVVAKVTVHEVSREGSAVVTAAAESSCRLAPEIDLTDGRDKLTDGGEIPTELTANGSRTRGEKEEERRAGGWERLDEIEGDAEGSGDGAGGRGGEAEGGREGLGEGGRARVEEGAKGGGLGEGGKMEEGGDSPMITLLQAGLVGGVEALLKGSSDDIGWLKKDPALPPVTDVTDNYEAILECVMSGIHALPDNLVYLLIPGLFSNLSPLYLFDTKKHFSSIGLVCHIAKIHSQESLFLHQSRLPIAKIHSLVRVSSGCGVSVGVRWASGGRQVGVRWASGGRQVGVRWASGRRQAPIEANAIAPIEANAIVIHDYIEELYWATKKKILILGHSKGAMDAAAALSLYQPLLLDKVAGLVFIQSPYGGSPVASDLLREGQWGDVASRTILGILMDKIFGGDIRCLDDLTHAKRRDFLAKHPFPVGEIPILSFHTEASKAAAVVASLSTVAHTEVPWLAQQNAKLAVGFPLSAGLAIMAVHLDYRYGAASDGLVTRADAEVPGSVVVRSRRKLDHAFMVFPPTSGVGGGGGGGGGGSGGGGNGGGGRGGGVSGGGGSGESEAGSACVHEASAAEMCEALATTLLATLQMRPKEATP
ncbi:unnamed protein product [Closterium sp. NIES-64]|nr:unnamed protein product [Closterium sp. NIES-64]